MNVSPFLFLFVSAAICAQEIPDGGIFDESGELSLGPALRTESRNAKPVPKKQKPIRYTIPQNVPPPVLSGESLCREGLAELFPSGNALHNVHRLPVLPACRVPGAKGYACAFPMVTASWELRPHLRRTNEGKATFFIRGVFHFENVTLLKLKDGKKELAVTLGPESKNSCLSIGKKTICKDFPKEWTPVTLEWRNGEVKYSAGRNSGTLPMEAGFSPDRVEILGNAVDEFRLSGLDGSFSVDWENDSFAGKIQTSGNGGMSVQLLGCDSFVITEDRASRECPVLNLVNTTPEKQTFELVFEVLREKSGKREVWSGKVVVPGKSSALEFVKFPFHPENDLYHMTVFSPQGLFAPIRKHFLHTVKRGEPKGDPLFGFHNGATAAFAAVPDSLNLDFSHRYLPWGYIQGVPWLLRKDRDGKAFYGLDPETPPSGWWWLPLLETERIRGRKMMLSLNEVPWLPWMRTRFLDKDNEKFAGDFIGGLPDIVRLKRFVSVCAERYKDSVFAWEISNEPNHSNFRSSPREYAFFAGEIAKTMKDATPDAPVYCIAASPPFEPWMESALQGGITNTDGFSLHTYTWPKQPDEFGLFELLERSRKRAMKYLKTNRFAMTEAGVISAWRDDPEKAYSPEEVAERTRNKERGFTNAQGKNPVTDEWASARSMTRNAVITLASGADFFTYFGWNLDWLTADWHNADPNWSFLSSTPRGEITPTWTTLAVAVQISQMQGVIRNGATPINSNTIRGGRFRKRNGGTLFAIWNASGTASVQIRCADAECVSMLGDSIPAKKAETGTIRLEIGENPVYIHTNEPDSSIIQ